jgi:hypothetical protein
LDHRIQHAQHGVVIIAIRSDERPGLDHIGRRQSRQQRKQSVLPVPQDDVRAPGAHSRVSAGQPRWRQLGRLTLLKLDDGRWVSLRRLEALTACGPIRSGGHGKREAACELP